MKKYMPQQSTSNKARRVRPRFWVGDPPGFVCHLPRDIPFTSLHVHGEQATLLEGTSQLSSRFMRLLHYITIPGSCIISRKEKIKTLICVLHYNDILHIAIGDRAQLDCQKYNELGVSRPLHVTPGRW
ncbi:hypothetical protein Y1Q_0018633 [Alligator mississippiensis]|uniref:Uncharacterized protein n=1 Tax=Alligator mississippiensis TaxID=8496 RepID=A0A151NRR4_ALLMI|nr:hypothetical protein Y1Q_0018633 [Alligator mississippiensis]